MPADHFEALLDSPYLRWFDLQGRPALVEIKIIRQEEICVSGGAKKRCPILTFKQLQGRIETIKPLIINKTNLESIAAIHGPKPSQWVGKSIVIFEDWTEFRKERVKCIRVRARKPEPERQPPTTESTKDTDE
ncbi:MAG: hypothetical protein Q8M16_07200 [Pirellulaceae bacterium]|nr:hypothetical protein [Pirellulaceae bacterium]